MDYDFTRRERGFGKIVFALTLDRKKMTERIVVGETNETRRHLENGTGEIYYDCTRPLGQLLLYFEADIKRQWNLNAMRLRESYSKIFPFESERWKITSPISDFLNSKYKNSEPSAMFAAIRTWEEYLNCYNINHGADLLIQRLNLLYRPFFLYGEYKPWQEEASVALSQTIHDGESQVELWYPVNKRPFECVVASVSFQPLIFYYLHKVEEWNFVFSECKVCGRYFLARSRHYELCSDECRKVQAVQAKQEFDERAKSDSLEQSYETAYYYWYNRLRKLKRAKNPDVEKISVVSGAFEVFRKEAIKCKGMVKRREMGQKEYADWLFKQQNEVDKLMDE
ncbi:MAG: hypothetical protein FWD71_16535 [Oscillospiraceae bacterium]|nr:hypothetical protein [Oscillospiraceae bacterium]